MMLLILSLLMSLAIGALVTCLCLPVKANRPVTVILGLCLASGIGIGLTSCIYFMGLLFNQTRYILILELLIAFALAAVLVFLIRTHRLHRIMDDFQQPPPHRFDRLFAFLFCGVLTSSLVTVVLAFLKEPHGRWDAWLIWNMHARFIYRSGEAWRRLFESGLDWTHLDYPLMLPLSVSKAWQAVGGETVTAPMALSLLFALALVGLLLTSLTVFRSRNQGYLGALVLMGSPFFIILNVYQVADIPLAFFILATVVIIMYHDRYAESRHEPLILAGLAAGLAAWTKNEGLLFLAVVFVVRLAFVMRSRGMRSAFAEAMWFMAGALPVLLIVVYFKTSLAPATDLFAGQAIAHVLQRVSDPQRLFEILSAYVTTGLTFTQGVVNIRTGIRFNPAVANVVLLVLYMTLMGVSMGNRERVSLASSGTILLVMLAGFFGVYMITPHDLSWHLTTSLNRLFMQLWPSVVFLCFMAVRTPEAALAAVGERTSLDEKRETGDTRRARNKKKRTKR